MSKYLCKINNNITNCRPPDTAMPGQVFYDSNQQSLVVYDGSCWLPYQVEFDMMHDAELAIEKMLEIMDRPSVEQLSDKYPMVRQALLDLEIALKLSQGIELDHDRT